MCADKIREEAVLSLIDLSMQFFWFFDGTLIASVLVWRVGITLFLLYLYSAVSLGVASYVYDIICLLALVCLLSVCLAGDWLCVEGFSGSHPLREYDVVRNMFFVFQFGYFWCCRALFWAQALFFAGFQRHLLSLMKRSSKFDEVCKMESFLVFSISFKSRYLVVLWVD